MRPPRPIAAQATAGALLHDILQALARAVEPDKSTAWFDARARELLQERGAQSSFLGYRGYPAVICTSINDEVVHGIPRADRILREGDLLSLDFGVLVDGYHADGAVTVPVGHVSDDARRLIDATTSALARAIAVVRAGVHVGDIGHAVQSVIEPLGYGIVRDLVGHGIGHTLHEPPQIPNVGQPGAGPVLRAGQTIAIEPMITMGSHEVAFLDDGWTVRTKDRSLAAHAEATVFVGERDATVLT